MLLPDLLFEPAGKLTAFCFFTSFSDHRIRLFVPHTALSFLYSAQQVKNTLRYLKINLNILKKLAGEGLVLRTSEQPHWVRLQVSGTLAA